MVIFKIVTLLNVLIFYFKDVTAEDEEVCFVKSDERSKKNNEFPRNCADLLEMGETQSGIRKIYPYPCCHNKVIKVFCDQETDGGGWAVIQYRIDNNQTRENFHRRWTEYKLGFGYLNKEFWLGLDNIHALVSNSLMELRVDLEDHEGGTRWAKYDYFYISDEVRKYRLDFGNYSGNSGDGLETHLGMYFSTYDQDNDDSPKSNCAMDFEGAWWFKVCHAVNLNGPPLRGKQTRPGVGIVWSPFRGFNYSLKKAKLSIRPKFT